MTTANTPPTENFVAPAKRIFTGPFPQSLDEQVAHYQREGFVILKSVLSKPEVAECHAELQRIAENYKSLPSLRDGFGLEPKQDPSRKTPTFRKIGGICDFSQTFNRLMKHRRVLDVLHALWGPVVELYRDVVMMKPARVGREKPWHQDSVYWPWDPMNMASAMTALDDATPENGCMQVVPGSHKKVMQHYGKELQCDIGSLEPVYAPLSAGDTLIFHGLTLHASQPNTSEFDRRVCIVSYKPDNLTFTGKKMREAPYIVSDRRAQA